FCQRMQALLGEEYEAFLSVMEEDSVRALRVNTDKIGTGDFCRLFPYPLTPLSYTKDGFIFDGDKVGNNPLHHAGAFYVQDPGAMATLAALPIEKGWRVADLCASPGGKSTQISSCIGEEGFLLANEYTPSRCRPLMENIERMGCRNVAVTSLDTRVLAEGYTAYFDLVLVDAPCSGEGMFRKYAYAQEEWSENEVLLCARRQRDILENASSMVKDGGYLLYSTCTFSLEENEMTVDAFLSDHPEFFIMPVASALSTITDDGIAFAGAAFPKALPLARRFYPHKAKGEGQFLCLMRKEITGAVSHAFFRDRLQDPSREELRLAQGLIESVMDMPKGYSLKKVADTAILVKDGIVLPDKSLCMAGVAVGMYKKGRIEPLHRFFSAFGNDFHRKINLSLGDERLAKYLHGDTFPFDLSDGYAAVLVEGCALGGVKVVNGIAKNHYPKGLRLP
ncbi:MAG: SAM-dependent methyltransferase, partial [Clostridia bacterium]|nr:SAM-dependent methyltransferase [Clostridia bacterium]